MLSSRRRSLVAVAVFVAAALAAPVTRAVLIEEIVAWVNGEIITRSEYEDEEKAMVADVYRTYTGSDLDQRVVELRAALLQEMIERKILLDRARSLFQDLDQIRDFYYKNFKEDQKITDDAEFARLIAQDGMTVEQFKKRLLETYAPKEVLRVEVRDRISVSDAEVDAFYKENPTLFLVPAKITVSEIVLKASTEVEPGSRAAEAETIVTELRGGADFAETARRVSEAGTRDEGGSLGEVGEGDLAAGLEKIAMALPAGGISDPISTTYGFHILRVDSRVDEHVTALDGIREQVRDYIANRRFDEDRLKYLDRLRSEAQWCVKAKYRDRLRTETLSTMRCQES